MIIARGEKHHVPISCLRRKLVHFPRRFGNGDDGTLYHGEVFREFSLKVFKECDHAFLEGFARYGWNKRPISDLGSIVYLTSNFGTDGNHIKMGFEQIHQCGQSCRSHSD